MPKHPKEILQDDFDWKEVFKYAEGFGWEDIGQVVSAVDGMNDEEEWIGWFILRDGRHAGIRAGCDYTGWG